MMEDERRERGGRERAGFGPSPALNQRPGSDERRQHTGSRGTHRPEVLVQLAGEVVPPLALAELVVHPTRRRRRSGPRTGGTLREHGGQTRGSIPPLAIGAEKRDDSVTTRGGRHACRDDAATQGQQVTHPGLGAPPQSIESTHGQRGTLERPKEWAPEDIEV